MRLGGCDGVSGGLRQHPDCGAAEYGPSVMERILASERPAIMRPAVKPLYGRPMPQSGSSGRADRYDWLCGALVALAAAVRIPLLEQPGYASDVAAFKSWGLFAVEHGLLQVYELSGVNYPPLSVLLWWCVAELARLINPAFGFQEPGLTAARDSVAYTVLVKVAACIADLLIGVLVYRWARHTAGPRWGVAAAAAILLASGHDLCVRLVGSRLTRCSAWARSLPSWPLAAGRFGAAR